LEKGMRIKVQREEVVWPNLRRLFVVYERREATALLKKKRVWRKVQENVETSSWKGVFGGILSWMISSVSLPQKGVLN
jgi:hypothetical protein